MSGPGALAPARGAAQVRVDARARREAAQATPHREEGPCPRGDAARARLDRGRGGRLRLPGEERPAAGPVDPRSQSQGGDRSDAPPPQRPRGPARLSRERRLAREGAPSSEGGAERAIRAAIKRVAERLGNTPAVCRSSYIDPRVLDRFRDGKTIESPRLGGEGLVTAREQARVERRVLELIE